MAEWHLLLIILQMARKLPRNFLCSCPKKTKKIKALLPEFNACQSIIEGRSTLTLDEALDPSKLSVLLQPNASRFPSKCRQELIDAYIMVKRTTEEIEMLESEMRNTKQYYVDRKSTLQTIIESFSQKGDAFSRGAVAFLRNLETEANIRIRECTELFVPSDQGHANDESDSDSTSDYNDDDDSD